MSKLNLGIIGAGRIARTAHMPVLAKMSDQVKILAIADLDGQLAEDLADTYNIPLVCQNYRELFNLKELDAVVISVPNYLHGEISREALTAGKHVFCEKPMAIDQREAQSIASVHREKGLTYVLGLNNRFRNDISYLIERIRDGDLGEIYAAKSGWVRRAGIPGWGSWFTSKSLAGGGALMDLGVHMLDLALYLMGHPKPLAVTGKTYSNYNCAETAATRSRDSINPHGIYDVEDAANAYIRFQNGSTLLLDVCWAGNIAKDDFYLEINGTKGGAYVNSNQGVYLFVEKNGVVETVRPPVSFDANEMRLNMWQHFINSIQNDKPLLNASEEGIIVHKILDAIYESSRQGQEVKIDVSNS